MKIGMQQTALGDASTSKCFVRARRAGAEGIGLCCRGVEDIRSLGDLRVVSKLRSLAERLDMPITGLHLAGLCEEASLIGTAGLIAQSHELVRLAIAAAGGLGRCDVIVPFFGRNRIELPSEFDTARAAMSELVETAEQHAVVLAVESSLHLSQLQEFLAGCGSDLVKVCLDTGDVTACRYDAVNMILGLGASDIAQVHLKDVHAASGHPPDFNVRLGDGDAPLGGVANALRSVRYDGWVVLETPPGDEKGAIAAAHMEYARKLFGSPQLPSGAAAGPATLPAAGGTA